MELKRLIIKNFGEVNELDYVPNEIINCVSETVANAISYVSNNQFAIRHYNSVELRSDTYLFAEAHFYQKGKKIVYTTEINGFEPPVFTKNGQKLTDDEVDSDPVLTRPYREDNLCVFVAHSNDDFLDYEKFVPSYFEKTSEYSKSYKDILGGEGFGCDLTKKLAVKIIKGHGQVCRKIGFSLKRIRDVSDCDRQAANYATFLQLVGMVDYHRRYKKDGIVARTPIIADGLVSAVDQANVRYMVYKTRDVARQAFFVERNPNVIDKYIRNILK